MEKRVQIHNPSGKYVGMIIGNTYHSTRDWKRQEIFYLYRNGIALSVSIIKRLKQLGVHKISMNILNFPEKGNFKVVIDLDFFIKCSERIHYQGKQNSDPQRRTALSCFTEIQEKQGTLI